MVRNNLIFRWQRLQRGNDFPLNVVIVKDEEAAAPLHSHDFEELMLIVNGTGCYSSPSGEYQLNPGDIFLLHQGQCHGFTKCKHLVVYNVLWDPQKLNFDFNTISHLPGYHLFFQLEPNIREKNRFKQRFTLNQQQLHKAKDLIEQIHEELLNRKDGYETSIYSLLSLLFIMICRKTVTIDESLQDNIQNIAEVIRYIDKNYTKPLNRSNLAKIANMSSATFFRHFRQATGVSPMNYLQNLRMNKAEFLLRTTDLPLDMISDKCGFCDSNYFILRFRQCYDITPYQYRKLLLKKDTSTPLQLLKNPMQ